MLTPEQEAAFSKAYHLYYIFVAGDCSAEEKLDILQNGFDALAKHIDDTDDIYFRGMFARYIQNMQDSNEFNLNYETLAIKVRILQEILDYVVHSECINKEYSKIILLNLIDVAFMYLMGTEVERNDTFAYIAFYYARIFNGLDGSDNSKYDKILSCFYKDDNGDYIYTG